MSALAATRALGYRRLATPLHAARATVAAGYCGALALCALIAGHPLLLAALLVAVLAAASAAGVGRALARAAVRTALPLALLSVLVNLLVSRGGLTVFARLGYWDVLGQVNLTVESAVYGLVFALRALVVTLACLLALCAADPDALLFAARRVSPRSALTAAIATRLLPVLGEDAGRLAEAQRCRPDGGAQGVRARLAILRATVGGALERSLDVAAVLEMRGYGAKRPRRKRARMRPPRSRQDIAFALSAVALLALTVLATFAVEPRFRAYPLVSLPLGASWWILAALVLVTALAPFALRRGIAR